MEPLSNPTTDEGQEYLTVLINEMKGGRKHPMNTPLSARAGLQFKTLREEEKRGNMQRF